MATEPKSAGEFFSFTLFKRPGKDGKVIIYAPLIEKSTGTILAQRSTGTDDERKAATKAPLHSSISALASYCGVGHRTERF